MVIDLYPYHGASSLLAGPRWTLPVLLALKGRTVRFNALQAELPGVSAKALAMALRSLVAAGLAERRPFATIPPRVDYLLTSEGEELVVLSATMRTLLARAADHTPALEHQPTDGPAV